MSGGTPKQFCGSGAPHFVLNTAHYEHFLSKIRGHVVFDIYIYFNYAEFYSKYVHNGLCYEQNEELLTHKTALGCLWTLNGVVICPKYVHISGTQVANVRHGSRDFGAKCEKTLFSPRMRLFLKIVIFISKRDVNNRDPVLET